MLGYISLTYSCVPTFSEIYYTYNSYRHISINKINNEVEKLNEWFKRNKLALNIDKSVFMLLQHSRKGIEIPKMKIDGNEFKNVEHFDFLGTTNTINKHMTLKHHVNKLSSKIDRTIGILNRLKHFLPTKVKLSIYNSLIRSQLQFGILTLGFSLEKYQITKEDNKGGFK